MEPPEGRALVAVWLAGLACVGSLGAAPQLPAGLPAPVADDATLRIDATAPGTPFPRGLLGVSQHPTSAAVVAAMRDAGVPHMRIDAYFDRAALAAGMFDWSEMDQRLGFITASGAQPVLILAYTPPWLATCPSYPGYHVEERFCPPRDLGAWRAVVQEGAVHAATTWGVRDFEVWNEPDNPGFWRGSLADYLDLYEASARGVQDAATLTGLPLRVGGPATWFADAAWIQPTLARAKTLGLPVDFVSFHWYGDYPLFGPVGPLPGTGLTDNPLLLAQTYGALAWQVRAETDAAGFPGAEVWLDEWNVDAGDAPRMRGAFGAAFVVAVAAELAGARADRANFFEAEGGVWGLFSDAAEPRPSWLALRALLELGAIRQPVERTGDPHVAALAARGADAHIDMVVANFHAQAGTTARARLRVAGWEEAEATVRDIDGTWLGEGSVPPEGLLLDLPDLAVRVVTLQQVA